MTLPSTRPVAAVTGASSGLGEEFANQLASRGYDLILVARRSAVLDGVKHRIVTKYGVTVDTISEDLATTAGQKNVADQIMATDRLEVMVNNAGFGLQKQFPDIDIEREVDMIQVHCVATLRLSHAALIPFAKKRTGSIINVSSVAAYLYGMAGAEYYATKSYILSFSKSLQCDVASLGIRVQALCPGLVHTGFHDTDTMGKFEKAKIPEWLWLPSDRVVQTSLSNILDTRWHRVVCVPSKRYKMLLAVLTSPFAAPILSWMGRWRAKDSG